MTKTAGAVMVLAASLTVGFLRARELGQRAKMLEEICALIAYVKAEISDRLTPVPEIISNLAEASHGELKEHFLRVLNADDFRAEWEKSTDDNLGILNDDERREFIHIGSTLGKYDVKDQSELLSRSLLSFEKFSAEARRTKEKEVRIKAAAAAAVGTCIVIILL